MSEQEQSPESQERLPRLYDNCDKCEEDYDLTPDNTTIHLHEVNPDCNFMTMTCDHCSSGWLLWHPRSEVVENAVNHGIVPERHRYPSENILNRRLEFLNVELVKPVEITQRHEKLIGSFATTLANCPDELLYDFITDENTNKPYPPRWT